MKKTQSLLTVAPKILPPLDPDFCPCIIGNRSYDAAVKKSKQIDKVILGIERENNLIARFELTVLAHGSEHDEDSYHYVERTLKMGLWARGGWKVFYCGPKEIGERLQADYSLDGARKFDVDLMSKAYDHGFEVRLVAADMVPQNKESPSAQGGHLDGNRIGFDLGASDYKVSAVQNGETVFSHEYPWNPKDETDPAYHIKHIQNGLQEAAKHLPSVDAIGGSSAGVLVDNRMMVGSLFRAVPEAAFQKHVKEMFINIGKEWKVPLEIINDGDVTALAGAMSLNQKALLGIAMGSSQAGGYIDSSGSITGWLNELAFAPVDYNPSAAPDEWSGDTGVGAMYFSQQAVNKLALLAGIDFKEVKDLPERLKIVQAMAKDKDPRALDIYRSIGVYLGYALPYYKEFYSLQAVLLLGRVTTGIGGDIILEEAKRVLATEFPEESKAIKLFVPDEKSRRVGQAIAAASLPEIK